MRGSLTSQHLKHFVSTSKKHLQQNKMEEEGKQACKGHFPTVRIEAQVAHQQTTFETYGLNPLLLIVEPVSSGISGRNIAYVLPPSTGQLQGGPPHRPGHLITASSWNKMLFTWG